VLEENGQAIHDGDRLAHIEATLKRLVSEREAPRPRSRGARRAAPDVHHGDDVGFSETCEGWTILELSLPTVLACCRRSARSVDEGVICTAPRS